MTDLKPDYDRLNNAILTFVATLLSRSPTTCEITLKTHRDYAIALSWRRHNGVWNLWWRDGSLVPINAAPIEIRIAVAEEAEAIAEYVLDAHESVAARADAAAATCEATTMKLAT